MICRFRRRAPKRQGFSLLELVAVVTLIGIVAAVTMTRMNKVDKATAIEHVDTENVQLLQHSIERYRFHEGQPPATLDDLLPNYIAKLPVSPAGGTFRYNSTTGIVRAPAR